MVITMVSFGIRTRDRFRAFPLDGALLFFQPSSGTSLRIENGRTHSFRRQAPRVVMFGITNHCNLRCSSCSRDTARASACRPIANRLGDLRTIDALNQRERDPARVGKGRGATPARLHVWFELGTRGTLAVRVRVFSALTTKAAGRNVGAYRVWLIGWTKRFRGSIASSASSRASRCREPSPIAKRGPRSR